jgi:glucose-6-phosphate 1-dehydrogenase
MAEFIPVPPFDLVVFGATGDLALRKLYPALLHRFLDGQIPENSRILGFSRQDLTDESFRELVRTSHGKFAPGVKVEPAKFDEFLKNHVFFIRLDGTAPVETWAPAIDFLNKGNGKTRIFYLSTAPNLFGGIAQRLQETGLATPTSRIVLEKLIGKDLASAREINEGVGAVFKEEQIYRIDHYLGKETVQNLMVLRFGNALIEPLWSRAAIDHVQITAAEEVGLEGRAGYYDTSGALRDMVQNHLLNLLCLVAMDTPSSIQGDDIRTEKLKVLRALKLIDKENVDDVAVRGQYGAGEGDSKLAAYRDELGKPSRIETYVAIKAEVDTWRWAGVPFYLRTGKRMSGRRSEIVVQFKPAPLSMFGKEGDTPNRLVLRIQPDEAVTLWLNVKRPGAGGLHVVNVPLNLSYKDQFTVTYPDAYERLLMDVARGNLGLFMRREEVEAAWVWADALLGAWESANSPLHNYPAGSDGPDAAEILLSKSRRAWWTGQ